jgi:hypothetical protein
MSVFAAPPLHDFQSLNRMTTTQLARKIQENCNDKGLLEAVHTVLGPRNSDKSRKLRAEIENLLGLEDSTETAASSHRRPWYLMPAYYVLGAIGALAVGIGHGAVAELWKIIWPQVQRFFF